MWCNAPPPPCGTHHHTTSLCIATFCSHTRCKKPQNVLEKHVWCLASPADRHCTRCCSQRRWSVRLRMACCYGNRDTALVECSPCGDVPEINPLINQHCSCWGVCCLTNTAWHTTYSAWWTEAAGDAGGTDTRKVQVLASSGTLQALFTWITLCANKGRGTLGWSPPCRNTDMSFREYKLLIWIHDNKDNPKDKWMNYHMNMSRNRKK